VKNVAPARSPAANDLLAGGIKRIRRIQIPYRVSRKLALNFLITSFRPAVSGPLPLAGTSKCRLSNYEAIENERSAARADSLSLSLSLSLSSCKSQKSKREKKLVIRASLRRQSLPRVSLRLSRIFMSRDRIDEFGKARGGERGKGKRKRREESTGNPVLKLRAGLARTSVRRMRLRDSRIFRRARGYAAVSFARTPRITMCVSVCSREYVTNSHLRRSFPPGCRCTPPPPPPPPPPPLPPSVRTRRDTMTPTV